MTLRRSIGPIALGCLLVVASPARAAEPATPGAPDAPAPAVRPPGPLPGPAIAGETHPEVVVIVNEASPVSVAIGEYYRARRGIPPENLARVSVPLKDPALASDESESISRGDYIRLVRDPLRTFLNGHPDRTRITTLVTTKGVPLHYVWQQLPMPRWLVDSTNASIEAELAILWSVRDGNAGVFGMTNPYFDADEPFAAFRARNQATILSYVTARLDGYAGDVDPATGVPADVKRLIDRAQERGTPGKWLVDEDPTKQPGFLAANRVMLRPVVGILRSFGVGVRHDATASFVGNARDLAGYASWGSNDDHDAGPPFYGKIGGVTYPGTFGPRSVALDLVSTNARTFTTPPKHYEQSLVADLIRLGVAGAAGYATEPVLAGCVRPGAFVRRFLEGVPAGEAHLRATPWLGWTNVWIGDPLMTVERPAKRANDDLDGDGVKDAADGCLEIADPEQRDTDGDGIDNVCDADFDGDGIVSTSFGQITAPDRQGDLDRLARLLSMGGYDANRDLDGDGKVTDADLSLAQLWLFLPPGPSGKKEKK